MHRGKDFPESWRGGGHYYLTCKNQVLPVICTTTLNIQSPLIGVCCQKPANKDIKFNRASGHIRPNKTMNKNVNGASVHDVSCEESSNMIEIQREILHLHEVRW